MNGQDFQILWLAGQALLHGQNPYMVQGFFYPLPFAYALIIPALLPLTISFILWDIINLGLMIYFLRRRFVNWLLYLPILHLFSSGQVELLWWGMERLMGRHWRGALLGAIITLKPQTALFLLPWHLLDWLRNDRKTLAQWFGFTALIWLGPLLWRPNWMFADWLHNGSPLNVVSAGNAPSIFSLLKITELVPLWPVLAVIAVGIFVWGQFQSKNIARACAMLASPVGLFYSTLCLMDTAPAWLLVPLSLVAAVISVLSGNFIAFAGLPLAVLIWNLRQTALKQRRTPILQTS